ncbi:MAG: hypothetical protein D6771_06360, partial [Zetaproteobacteria bacterium]
PIPDRAQLADCLRALAPGIPWLVYLDLGGVFRGLDTRTEPIIGNLRIAVRGEIASAPAYVGEAAAADALQVDTLFRQFLAGWVEHLHTGRTGIFIPEPEESPPVQESLRRIQAWRPEGR